MKNLAMPGYLFSPFAGRVGRLPALLRLRGACVALTRTPVLTLLDPFDHNRLAGFTPCR